MNVTVFGGSGFVGSRIVKRLIEEGARVRVAVRHPERVEVAEEIEAVRADVWDAATVEPALRGADAVVNVVGHYVETGNATFEAIHGQGARNVAVAATEAGVPRLVHVSGLGADPKSPSAYVRARATGERLVSEAFPAVTILRPSVIFGPGDAFFTRLASLARVLPGLPMFGSGTVRLQPVFVGDVAEAALQAIARDEARGQIYELGGPKIYTYRDLLRLMLEQTGRRRLLMPVPYAAWDVLARLPGAPVSSDQVKLMRDDNVVGDGASTLADLGVRATPVEEVLPTYLGRL
ncbi:MAG: complex I NDUFA9 subunit family protein [Geminicoccaceae bacterium]|nr:complex I NDUFA9 subunit family protein [Geminicoccaceae bacterium]